MRLANARTRGRVRVGLVVAALFAALAVVGGGAGWALGAAASIGSDHGPDGISLHHEHDDPNGPDGPFRP